MQWTLAEISAFVGAIVLISGAVAGVIAFFRKQSAKSADDAVIKESIGAKEHIDKEIKALKSETMSDQKDDRVEIKRALDQLRTELKADIAQLRSELIAGLASNVGSLLQVDTRLAALNQNFIDLLKDGKGNA